ncbi:aldehyde dehydrogenase family protein [Streptomyces parvulus]|uniref:Aldehyde dehydrogenase n=1 Tax=Streptomyces parvulus TaxID=146923 RepID=A0A369UXD3_9ACTN|nr:aldehyde dehydrogenase family protein [Streptomyces parvulus]RDD85127.1 aldehyde dehydrogenase family protein [Streptomyces parvulus]
MTSTGSHAEISVNKLRDLLNLQRKAFLAEGPPSAEVRRNRLDRLLAAVLGSADELAEALSADFGNRPAGLTLGHEVAASIDLVEHLRANLEEWMRPVEYPDDFLPTTVDVDPLGVVGVVGPWNFPITLVVHPAAEAIAAGNRVMIKFSDGNVRTGEVFAKAIAKHFDPSEVAVVLGGAELSAAFSALPFNHLMFTGSPAVGKLVQRAAAENLTPVTLELGGKNPVVVGHDADITDAAVRVAGSRLANGGQFCLGPDYVFVPRPSVDEFVERTQQAFIDLLPRYATNPAVTSVINEKNFDRISNLVNDAVAKGAQTVLGVSEGGRAALADRATRRIPPTILLGVTDEMLIADEEIFGPVLVVYPYDDIKEVIEYVIDRPSPLAAYWYGDDSEDFREFRRRTASGGMARNDFAVQMFQHDVPFGGVGQSGMGAYHGKAGFDTFSHRRAVTTSQLPVPFAVQSVTFNEEETGQTRARISSALDRVTGRLRQRSAECAK